MPTLQQAHGMGLQKETAKHPACAAQYDYDSAYENSNGEFAAGIRVAALRGTLGDSARVRKRGGGTSLRAVAGRPPGAGNCRGSRGEYRGPQACPPGT